MKMIDKECISLVDILNSLPGISTFSSCCGHGKEPFRIWFTCTSWTSLAILTRSTDKNYSTGNFHIKSINSDVDPCYNFMLESVKPLSQEEMEKESEYLINNINHWTEPEYKDYFRDYHKYPDQKPPSTDSYLVYLDDSENAPSWDVYDYDEKREEFGYLTHEGLGPVIWKSIDSCVKAWKDLPEML